MKRDSAFRTLQVGLRDASFSDDQLMEHQKPQPFHPTCSTPFQPTGHNNATKKIVYQIAYRVFTFSDRPAEFGVQGMLHLPRLRAYHWRERKRFGSGWRRHLGMVELRPTDQIPVTSSRNFPTEPRVNLVQLPATMRWFQCVIFRVELIGTYRLLKDDLFSVICCIASAAFSVPRAFAATKKKLGAIPILMVLKPADPTSALPSIPTHLQ